jgi:hypothetical protein
MRKVGELEMTNTEATLSKGLQTHLRERVRAVSSAYS